MRRGERVIRRDGFRTRIGGMSRNRRGSLRQQGRQALATLESSLYSNRRQPSPLAVRFPSNSKPVMTRSISLAWLCTLLMFSLTLSSCDDSAVDRGRNDDEAEFGYSEATLSGAVTGSWDNGHAAGTISSEPNPKSFNLLHLFLTDPESITNSIVLQLTTLDHIDAGSTYDLGEYGTFGLIYNGVQVISGPDAPGSTGHVEITMLSDDWAEGTFEFQGPVLGTEGQIVNVSGAFRSPLDDDSDGD